MSTRSSWKQILKLRHQRAIYRRKRIQTKIGRNKLMLIIASTGSLHGAEGLDPSTTPIYGIKIDTGLECAVEVFGSIAMRDKLDHNRNIIFERTRDNCQVVTAQKRDLLLTGPTRAAVYGPVYFDGILKVKGRTEAEDKDICYLAMKYDLDESMNSFPYKFYSSKLSVLQMTCGLVPSSVEATIAMRVVDGSWPSDLPCMILKMLLLTLMARSSSRAMLSL